MTREEAITYLEDAKIKFKIPKAAVTARKTNEALDMAIKVLEQQPCEDCISREDALMCMTGEYLADKEYKSEDIISKHIQRLRALPSVTPQPKTGHWIFDEILDRNYYCSECKSMGVDYWDYCPYCGAKMIEPQESEE
jgi:hypothetical protein